MGAHGDNKGYEITLSGCFSCFSISCNMINDLINTFFMRYDILAIKIAGKQIELSNRDIVGAIREEYKEKHQWFRDNLTNKTFNASPSTFSEELKRANRKSFW